MYIDQKVHTLTARESVVASNILKSKSLFIFYQNSMYNFNK